MLTRPGCDKSTGENEKDGGAFVEELEAPVVDADLRVDKQSNSETIRLTDNRPKEHHRRFSFECKDKVLVIQTKWCLI